MLRLPVLRDSHERDFDMKTTTTIRNIIGRDGVCGQYVETTEKPRFIDTHSAHWASKPTRIVWRVIKDALTPSIGSLRSFGASPTPNIVKRNYADNATPVNHIVYADFLGVPVVLLDSCPIEIRQAWERQHDERKLPFVWRKGIGTKERYKEHVRDGRVDLERIVMEFPTIETSAGVEFAYTASQELKPDTNGETCLQRALKRWQTARFDRNGDIVPGQSVTTTANGLTVPALPLEQLGQWSAGNVNRHCFAESLDVSIRGAFLYVSTSIAKAFRSICWKPGLSSGRLWHEFVSECVQTISLHHLALLRGIERFYSVCHGLRAVQRVFEMRYGSVGGSEDNAHARKRGGASVETIAERNGLNLADAVGFTAQQSRILDYVREFGVTTQSEIAKLEGISQATVSKRIKMMAAYNAVAER